MAGDTFEVGGDDEKSDDAADAQRTRLPLLDVLGAVAIGGIVLHQLRDDPRPATAVGMRSAPRGEMLEVSGETLEAARDSVSPAVATVVTPEPGAALLLGSGLSTLGLFVFRRSRRVLHAARPQQS